MRWLEHCAGFPLASVQQDCLAAADKEDLQNTVLVCLMRGWGGAGVRGHQGISTGEIATTSHQTVARYVRVLRLFPSCIACMQKAAVP